MTSKKDIASIASSYVFNEERALAAFSRGVATNPPIQTAEVAFENKKLRAEIEHLTKTAGEPYEIALDLIDASPFQVRQLDKAQVLELAANLRENPLATPIVVRRVGDRFELVSGHHRLEAFRLLRREKIPAIAVNMDDEATERAVVFDNLIAPQLPDYERYLGLARLRDRHKWTYTEIAERTGLSAAVISHLFVLERLPSKTLERISAHPEAIGTWLLKNLAPYIEKNPDGVDTAVQAVIEGRLTDKEAISKLKGRRAAEAPAVVRASPIRQGRAKYADLTRRRDQVVIAFTSEEEAAEVFSLVEELLRKRAGELTKQAS